MTMWMEALFWYLVTGVLLSAVMTVMAYKEAEHLKVSDWARALAVPIVWPVMVIWMMWEDK